MDANLLVLLIVGSTDPRRLKRKLRFGEFSHAEFAKKGPTEADQAAHNALRRNFSHSNPSMGASLKASPHAEYQPPVLAASSTCQSGPSVPRAGLAEPQTQPQQHEHHAHVAQSGDAVAGNVAEAVASMPACPSP